MVGQKGTNFQKVNTWSDWNWTRTQNHFVLKRTLNHLAKLAKWWSCVLSTYLHGEFDRMFLSCTVAVQLQLQVQLQSVIQSSRSHLNFRFRAYAWSREFLDIHATIECGFTLKRVHDMIRTYSQMHHTDKYSEHSWIIWLEWPNGRVFVYELSGTGFESSCNHLRTALFFPNFFFPLLPNEINIMSRWSDFIPKLGQKKKKSLKTLMKYSPLWY